MNKSQRFSPEVRERNPALVWKSARGEYAVHDVAMHRWFEQRVREGRWPPIDPQGQLAMQDDEPAADEPDRTRGT